MTGTPITIKEMTATAKLMITIALRTTTAPDIDDNCTKTWKKKEKGLLYAVKQDSNNMPKSGQTAETN